MPSVIRVAGCLGVLLFLTPARGADPHQYVPADARVLATVKFRKLLDAPLLDRDKPVTVRGLLQKEPPFLDIVGIRPLEDVTALLVALPGAGEVRKLFVVAQGKFDAARIRASVVRIHKDSVKEHRAGGVAYQQFKVPVHNVRGITTPADVFLAVPDETTCLISLGSQADLETALGAKKAGTPAELRALLEKHDREGAVASFALLGELQGPFAELPKLRKMFGLLRGLGGSVRIDEEVSGQVVAAVATAESAREVEEIMRGGMNTITGGVALMVAANKQLQPILDILKTVRVSHQGTTVTMRGKLERDVLEEILKPGPKER
jgi:hypothetical protein